MVPFRSHRLQEMIEQARIFESSLIPTKESSECGFTNGFAFFITMRSFLENLGKTRYHLQRLFVSAIQIVWIDPKCYGLGLIISIFDVTSVEDLFFY